MVATLQWSLIGQTGFLQEVDDHIRPGQFASAVEMNPDKLALKNEWFQIYTFLKFLQCILTNLDELSFLAVLAFPNASKMGFV